MGRGAWLVIALAQLSILVAVVAVYAWSALPVADDPLVRMPGTQPGQVKGMAATGYHWDGVATGASFIIQ
jgi:hypothetical protein